MHSLLGPWLSLKPHYFGGSSNLHEEDINYEKKSRRRLALRKAPKPCRGNGIDTFAAAIGNLHGKYPVPKQLDLVLLQHVRDQPECQISLHGGSGTPLHYFEEAARIGVSKININSDMRCVFSYHARKVLADNPKEYAIVKLMPVVYDAVQRVVEEKIEAFGSTGRAIR